jgi:hypothetical protein
MALTYRFYRTLVMGTGARANPFRSKLTTYITADATGQNMWDWVNWARGVRYAIACCDSTLHTIIATDAEITALSPELASRAAVDLWLDGTVASLPQASREMFGTDGCPSGWVTAQTTRRELFAYWSTYHSLLGRFKRAKDVDGLAFFAQATTLTMADIPTASRTAVETGMHANGLEATWITDSTPVAAVVHAMVTQVGGPPLSFGEIRF